jgi:hypothetical protein
MSEPYQDNYSTQFHSFADMATYHDGQAAHSRWERVEVNSLHVEPLDESSPLYGDISSFDVCVSEDAVKDTAKNLGLAVKFRGQIYPVRDTAYKGLLDRARISGTALAKLRRTDLAAVLNACLELHKDSALLLIRDQKGSGAHSGDETDYSILPIDKLIDAIKTKLSERFPDSEFDAGYTDHSLTAASWLLPGQREDLIGTYQETLIAQGKAALAGKLMPGIRFCTSDTGVASATVSALLLGLRYPIHIGGMLAVEHRGQTKIEDFQNSLDMLFARFGDSVARLQNLAETYLDYPVNAMTAVCKTLKMPKKTALEAIGMFEVSYGGGTATAHDVFMGMQEIMFILKTENTPESKMLTLEESMARALTLNWAQYDLAKAVIW